MTTIFSKEMIASIHSFVAHNYYNYNYHKQQYRESGPLPFARLYVDGKSNKALFFSFFFFLSFFSSSFPLSLQDHMGVVSVFLFFFFALFSVTVDNVFFPPSPVLRVFFQFFPGHCFFFCSFFFLRNDTFCCCRSLKFSLCSFFVCDM
jgi:hypothetical protein